MQDYQAECNSSKGAIESYMIRPRDGWVVIKPVVEPAEHKTQAGVIVPNVQPLGGTPILVGQIVGVSNDKTLLNKIVAFNGSAGFKFRHEGQDCTIVEAVHVVAFLE